MAAKPCDRGQLATLQGDAHADDRPERAGKDGRHAKDAEAAGYRGERQRCDERRDRDNVTLGRRLVHHDGRVTPMDPTRWPSGVNFLLGYRASSAAVAL